MKKFCLTLCMALFSLLASATGIELSQGKATYLNDGGKIGVVFNLDYAKLEDGKSVKTEWASQYDAYTQEGRKFFMNGFNEAIQGKRMIKEDSVAAFSMYVEFTKFVVSGGKYKVWADITVTDSNAAETVCMYKVTEFEIDTDATGFSNYTETMKAMAAELSQVK